MRFMVIVKANEDSVVGQFEIRAPIDIGPEFQTDPLLKIQKRAFFQTKRYLPRWVSSTRSW
jgi:hypothetical protein